MQVDYIYNLSTGTAYNNNSFCIDDTEKFNDLARKNNLSPSQMALAFVNSREFLTSNIIGATNLEQLKENINSVKIELSSDLLKEIDEIHNENPFPCP